MSTNLLDNWNEIKVLVESLEVDVAKHANGNASAGVRARKGLRVLKARVGDLVKVSVAAGKDKAE